MASVQSHNSSVFSHLHEGDMVEFQRGFYSHWGVYIGGGEIVHLAGEDDDGIDANIRIEHLFSVSGTRIDKAKVCIDKFWSVAGQSKAFINNNKDKSLISLRPEEIVRRALSKVGEVGYSLLSKNCEHFANWCRYGVEKSDQVDSVLTGVAIVTATAVAVGFIAAAAKFWNSDKEKEEE